MLYCVSVKKNAPNLLSRLVAMHHLLHQINVTRDSDGSVITGISPGFIKNESVVFSTIVTDPCESLVAVINNGEVVIVKTGFGCI